MPIHMLDSVAWNTLVRTEKPLQNYPHYQWKTQLNASGKPQFEAHRTVSRHLVSYQGPNPKVCPYGDSSVPVAIVQKTESWQQPRDAYTLSALRFKLNPFSLKQVKSRPSNQPLGIPKAVRHLYKISATPSHQVDTEVILKASSLARFDSELDKVQQKMRALFMQELVPHMSANPLDVNLHRHELTSDFADDLTAYVALQNHPCLFFDLLQWLERDVAKYRRTAALANEPLTNEQAMIQVMRSWCDRDGYRRKKPIVFPIGVPIDYIQTIRRKNQPFMTKEFGHHAHGALNHWLQEHVWRRFCYRYPERHRLHPCQFLKTLGSVHFAFPDTIYELHVEDVANPANTNFWAILQYYLPLLSPWP